MNKITPYQSNLMPFKNFTGLDYASRELSSVSISSQQNKDITIFTEDGDKVTLSSDQQIEAFYLTYSDISYQNFSGASDNTSITLNNYAASKSEIFAYESNLSLSISVEGELDEQEIKDIKKAIKSIDKIMMGILNGGNVEKAADQAMMLASLKSISGIEADYSYEKTISVEHIAMQEISAYSKNGLPENILSLPDTGLNNIRNMIDEMAGIVKDSGVKPSKMVEPIKKLFSNILKDVSGTVHQNPHNKHMIELTELIRDALLKKIE